MGRNKAHKPRKPNDKRKTPRIVDMMNVSADMKKNVVLSRIMHDGDQTWQMLQALTTQKYGQFTVEERDILDLPPQARHEVLRDLRFYASAQIPAQAPIDAREAAVRTAANCQQALGRLLPLVEQIARQDPN
ncbi:hypothetical protein ACOKM5_43000 [Streptomyces sp. BH097]|uniref:hypothetical protein n=1 Tax=unclassified Streptomyces TaxID=2593676 RepID=UPI003BB4A760